MSGVRSLNLNPGKLMYSIEEASALLCLSRAHLYRLMDVEEIGSVRIGRCRRITANQLKTFVQQRERESGFGGSS